MSRVLEDHTPERRARALRMPGCSREGTAGSGVPPRLTGAADGCPRDDDTPQASTGASNGAPDDL